MPSRPPFFASARGRLLIFNLLVVAVTLMVSGVAVLGFRHASQIQEQVQQQTLDDMTGSMNLARDTANVATAAYSHPVASTRVSVVSTVSQV